MAIYDEEAPRKPAAWTIGEDLSKLSIDELRDRIEALRAEIGRIEEALETKRESMSAADSFFKR